MPRLSIIFATVRKNYALPAIAALEASLAHVDHEIVCVSPFEIAGRNIRHLPETEQRGCYPAYQLALEASTGETIAFFSDDMIATPHWADGLVEEIRAAEARVVPYIGGLCALNWPLCFSVYGRFFANRPIFGRRTAEALSPMFGDEFPHHFGDIDLAMRTWTRGGRVDQLTHRCALLLSEHPYARSSGFAESDQYEEAARRFQAKWAARFGADPLEDPSQIVKAHRINGL